MAEFNKVSIPVNIRFKDIDAMGHVNNAVYITYFEEGRKAFLINVLDVSNPSEYSMILATIQCEYLKPLQITDEVMLETWLSGIKTKSFKFKYRIYCPGTDVTFAKGESVMVAYDYKKKASMPLSEEFLSKTSGYTEQV